jgi:hypothetical protein
MARLTQRQLRDALSEVAAVRAQSGMLRGRIDKLEALVAALAAQLRAGGRPWISTAGGMRPMTDNEMIICFPPD